MALNPSNSSNLEQVGLEGLNTYSPKKLRRHVTLTTPTWGQFVITEPVEKPPYPAVGKQGASHLYLGGPQLSSAGTGSAPDPAVGANCLVLPHTGYTPVMILHNAQLSL